MIDFQDSSNKRKYKSKNKLKQLALEFFFKALLSFEIQFEKALDAGCGEGFAAANLSSKFPDAKLIGVDISAQAVKNSKKYAPQMPVLVGDVTRLPFKDNQFDLVLCLEVLEHLHRPEQAVATFIRLTRRYVLLSVPNEPIFRTLRMLEGSDLLRWGDHPEHIHHWNYFSFARFLERNGLNRD